MHPIEKKALEDNCYEMPYGENRRFACTFELEEWMDEMVVEVKTDFGTKVMTTDELYLRIISHED